MKPYSNWLVLSLAVNGLLLLALGYLWQKERPGLGLISATWAGSSLPAVESPTPEVSLGDRYQLNYQQWVTLLAREAGAIARQNPKRLGILLGDSITLWFAQDLLPPDYTWLNQGISGETSLGLLRRLDLLDRTNPEIIFVAVGVNDLLRGVGDGAILGNQRTIVRYLQEVHPGVQIVVQSILPHSGARATREQRDRLLTVPNSRIRQLNKRLEQLAQREGVLYFDLYPLMADERGNLRVELSTDGLHLNREGYKIWSAALQMFIQLKFDSE